MDTPNSPPHDKSSKDSKSSKALPTNNQIYLTLPPWFLLGMHNSIVHAIHRPALEFLLACGVLWGSVGREILTTT